MKFKSFVGKQVFIGGDIVTFKDGTYETSDKQIIDALKSAKNVELVKPRKPKADSKQVD